MSPPTSTDEKHGTVIDGTARSAEWRQNQRAEKPPEEPGNPEALTDLPAADFGPAAAKDFASSLMVPASTLLDEPA